MGRFIDETDLMNLLYVLDDARHELFYAIKKIPELPTVEAIPKDQINKAIEKIEQYICDVETDTAKAQGMAQALDMFEQALGEAYDSFKKEYENRLKAEKVAMLTEIQLEIEELEVPKDANIFNMGYWTGITDSKEVIQQKINNLQVNNSKVKEQDDGTNSN